MTHKEAVESLAISLDPSKWCIFKEPVLSHREDGIPDVLCLRKSYSNFEIRVYEVKVSDEDLNRDLNSGKYTKYFNMAHKVYFALGPEVSKKAEERLKGEKVGVTRFKTTWRTTQHAPRVSTNDNLLSPYDYLALLMNGNDVSAFRRISKLEQRKILLLKGQIRDLEYTKPKQLSAAAAELRKETSKLEDLKVFTMEKARETILREAGLYWSDEKLQERILDKAVREAHEKFKEAFTSKASEIISALRTERKRSEKEKIR